MSKSRARSSFRPKLISLAVASCFAAGTALANPTGPAVVHGTAAIHRAGNLLQITNSPNAIINWQSFSIGANEITRFLQQSQASAVLNRVTGAGGRIDPSVILGTLQSNGRVFLINPNGILFGAGAKVDVAGLVASSLNLSNADFLAGKLLFTEVPGAGAVINQGSISTGAGGGVYLVGSAVTNSGIITSPQGEVVLAAGNTVELVNPGTPNLRVEIAAADNAARNLGQIMSDAGRVGIYAGLINHSGTIRADSAVAEGGRIVLKATKSATLEAGSVTTANGASGGRIEVQSSDTTLVSGTVEAKGGKGKGGTVHVLGNLVGLIDRASINASGRAGGGTVLVGGDFQGGNLNIQNAYRTYFGPDATISADAITSGDGGRVVVWSDDATRAYGTISARGGAQSGDGGFVEVSGKKWLDFDATVDTRAPNGASGTLLLDPTSIWIAASLPVAQAAGMTSSDTSVDTANPPFFQTGASGVTESLLMTGTLEAALATNGFVTVSTFNQSALGVGDINVVSNVGWGTTGTLQLSAENKINLGAQLTGPNGRLFLSANNGITQTAAGRIMAEQLYANGGSGSVLLHLADNRVNLLTGRANGEFRFRNAQTLEIGTINSAESSGVFASNDTGPATVNINVTSGLLKIVDSVSASASNGGAATVTLTGANGITVDGGGQFIGVFANGGFGVEGSGGNATITLNGGSGPVQLINSASVEARGGGAGQCEADCLGGNALVQVSTQGSFTMDGSEGFASGGDGLSGKGGSGTFKVTAGGALTVRSNSVIEAQGGDDFNGGDGGAGEVPLAAGGAVNITGSDIGAFGGFAGSSARGGAGDVEITSNGGSMVVQNSFIEADGAEGGQASIALAAASSITLTNVTLSARGGESDGGAGSIGGKAAVTLTATGGSILIQDSPRTIEAIGGSAFGAGTTGGSAEVKMVAAGDITIDGSTVVASGGGNSSGIGGSGVVSFGPTSGIVELLNGSRVEANGGSGSVTSGLGQVAMQFSGRTTGGWFVNGVESDITDGSSGGFFVNGSPAILDTNLIVTYLGQEVFIDNLVASMNQQADILADQLKAGEVGTEEEEKKKLPFCD